MKKITLSLLLCFLSASIAFAQTPADSATIVSIKWNETKVKRGVVWKSAQVELYSSPQSLNVLVIKPSKKNRLGIAYCVDTLIPTSSLCKKANAVAGVNASFFDMKKGGSVDYMRVDGKTIHEGRDSSANSNAAIVVDGRKVSIVKQHKAVKWAQELSGENVMATGPLLVQSAVAENFPETKFNTTRHPRTCAAVTDNGTILLITVDGRAEGKAAGMSTKELAYFVKLLGAKDAVNFDGGGSTAMYIQGYEETGIVNYPSDNKVFDHKGERKVANVVYLKP